MPKLDDQISTLQERLKQLKLRQQRIDSGNERCREAHAAILSRAAGRPAARGGRGLAARIVAPAEIASASSASRRHQPLPRRTARRPERLRDRIRELEAALDISRAASADTKTRAAHSAAHMNTTLIALDGCVDLLTAWSAARPRPRLTRAR